MTATNYLYIITMGLIVLGGGWVRAESDVTIVPAPASSTSSTAVKKKTNPDGTPIVHKSLHKKKSKASRTAGTTSPTIPSRSPNPSAPIPPPGIDTSPGIVTTPASPVPSSTEAAAAATWTSSHAIEPAPAPSAVGPAVETGLPVARHPDPLAMAPLPTGLQNPVGHSVAVADPTSISGHITSEAVGTYSPPSPTTTLPSNDFVFTNFNRKVKNIYPWKTNIITTMFWIGEGGSSISSTDNVASAWDANWRTTNLGGDNPNDRNGYAPADHAPDLNPFYVALPFNDLVYPDKAREWLPPGWHRPRKDGKEVSACKDRWVEIKNAQGRVCYAQWEDVGPLRYDHAEYVFGPERPDTYTRAGLDVSPAVAQYLDIDGQNRAITSWRFVDDEDVPPGQWLKYDELALIYQALHSQKNSSASSLPIQRASEPIDDPSSDDANKKKVGAAKG